ncbi:hypothetical protein E2I00_019271, partial [Balaenoptera physalus]
LAVSGQPPPFRLQLRVDLTVPPSGFPRQNAKGSHASDTLQITAGSMILKDNLHVNQVSSCFGADPEAVAALRHLRLTTNQDLGPEVPPEGTQEIFNCRIDEDVTDEQPYKLIKKEDIFADFENRAAVSDFYPVKKIIQEYPGNELLLVYDKDFKYGLNFYLIGTEEGKENYLNPPEVPEEQEEYKEHIPEDIYIYKPPICKPWVSLGSEKEIEEESVKESTKEITYMISRKRSEFGAPVKFSDQNASSVKDAYIECTAYPDKNFTLKQLERDVGMQVVPKIKDTSTQTRWTYPKNATTQYYPRELSEEEKEALGQSKTLTEFLNNVSISVEIALQQNEIMNTFINDWKSLAEEEGTFGDKTDTHLREYQSFTDLHNLTEKMITCVSWHPIIYGLIAVSVAVRLSFEERVHFSGKLLLQPSLILFWSFSDPIHPQIVMWDITAHADRIENIKADGSRSKNVTLKPMFLLEPESNKEAMYIRHCAVSSIENGHRKVITDIHWLPDTFEVSLDGFILFSCWLINRLGSVFENRSGISCQLVTCSADCTICFWDIRPQKALTPQPPTEKKKEESIEVPFDVPSTFLHLNLSWKPLSKIRLSKGETTLDHCPTKLSLSEDSLLYKAQGNCLCLLKRHLMKFGYKMLAQSKATKAGEMNPYQNLEGGLGNHLKPIDDFCTKFFVGTEIHSPQLTSGSPLLDLIDRDLFSIGGLPILHCRNVNSVIKGEMAFSTPTAKKPVSLYTVHDGGVHTVQRSPFYKDIILTVGGWNVAIWKEGIMSYFHGEQAPDRKIKI